MLVLVLVLVLVHAGMTEHAMLPVVEVVLVVVVAMAVVRIVLLAVGKEHLNPTRGETTEQ